MLWFDAPTSSFSLIQTSSDIWFGDRNPAVSHTDIADCFQKRIFSPAYFVVGTSAKAVKCYIISAGLWLDTPVCLFLYIKLQLALYAQWRLLKRLLTYSVSYGKIVTSPCGQ
jgi:hypothetical protein